MDDERRVRAWFAAHGARFGLGAAGVTCRAVLNLGGFVNRSFTVGDGRRRLHVKLASAPNAPGLRQWAELHRRLEAGYRAPRLLGVVEGGALAGEAIALIFECVDGRALQAPRDHGVLADAVALAARLHRDPELAAALPAAPARTCADDLVETIVDRLRADLAEGRGRMGEMPFLDPGFPAWAAAEVDALERAARAAPDLAAPAAHAVHGDLHGGNVLVEGPGRWWVLDWDDLHAGGDGALDVLWLLWPLARAGGGRELLEWYARQTGDAGVPARAGVYRRAILLDEVIDSLADWLEADALPAHREAVRGLKRVAHQEALAAYVREYGTGAG